MDTLTRAEQVVVDRHVAALETENLRVRDAVLRELSWAHAHFWATVAMCLIAGLGAGIMLGRL